jgi:hypothetical protein
MKTEVQIGEVRLDGVWEGPTGSVFIEVRRTNSARDLRDALLILVYALHQVPTAMQAICVLVDSRLSDDRVSGELASFKDLLKPELADRLHALVLREGHLTGSIAPSEDLALEIIELALDGAAGATASRPSAALPAKHAVVATLVAQQLIGGGIPKPLTLTRLKEITGVSYPTVAGALRDLRIARLVDHTKGGVRLLPMSAGQLEAFAAVHAKQRKSWYFVDPTGMSSPMRLMKRLATHRAANAIPEALRVGGVLGAAHHYPLLDITAPLRLDLAVPAGVTALDIARALDAGLVERTDPQQQPVLAIHGTFDPLVHTDLVSQVPYASALECLADLIEMGYQREAREFAQHVLAEARSSKELQREEEKWT